MSEIAKNQQNTPAERFKNTVMRMATQNNRPKLTESQETLAMNYFIGIDRTLANSEIKRIKSNANNKDEKYNNNLAYTWNNVNLQDLCQDVVSYARMGLDILQDAHVWAVPFKNNSTQQYDVNLMKGYNGIKIIAKKYALTPPIAEEIELVYSSDKFIPYKRSASREIEDYEFTITNPFDRGEIVGGFGYLQFEDPKQNKLIIMSRADMDKRKPEKASAEFWGGKSTKYVGGKRESVELEGWLPEMYRKTLTREVYSTKYLPIDSNKIDSDYRRIKLLEASHAELEAENEISNQANQVPVEIEAEFSYSDSSRADEEPVSLAEDNQPEAIVEAPVSQEDSTDSYELPEWFR